MVARRLQQLGVKARDGTDWPQNTPVGMITEDGIFPITNMRAFKTRMGRSGRRRWATSTRWAATW